MQWLTDNWLAALLVLGALIFLLRRAGVGRGFAGNRSHQRAGPEVDWSSTDPVSGESVASDSALTAQHGGRVYRFASRETLERFESDPERYLRGGAGRHGPGTAHRHGGHGGCC
jgi:YHS domain-containing protein